VVGQAFAAAVEFGKKQDEAFGDRDNPDRIELEMQGTKAPRGSHRRNIESSRPLGGFPGWRRAIEPRNRRTRSTLLFEWLFAGQNR
jgi:hypothetical protein